MPDAPELSLDRVVHYPLPGMNIPASVQFSPDGKLLTYLWSEDGSLVRQLWAYELTSHSARIFARAPGEGDTDATVSVEEALRRERTRTRGFGITNYAWARERPLLFVPLLGRLFVADGEGGLRSLNELGPAVDPQLNRAGDAVAYVRDGELWVLDIDAAERDRPEPRRLTFDASPANDSGERLITNGLAEYIAQEEMGRGSGFWWSPDGKQIAFVQVDNAAVPPYRIVHQGEDAASVETHRYPFAGETNASVRVGIVDAAGSGVHWVALPDDQEYYVARVDWAPDNTLFLQLEDRDQRRLDLLRYDTESGKLATILSECAATWINLHDDLRFVEREASAGGGYELLWSSERSGFRHLYLYSLEGAELRQLTSGSWPVDRVLDVRGRWVYFLASPETPLERHVYRVELSGGEPERLSSAPGMHSAVLSPSGDCFADIWDAIDRPPSVWLRRLDGGPDIAVFEGDPTAAEALELPTPELLSLPAEDGTTLYAALYRQRAAAGPSPLLVSVYGGPHVQQVINSWSLRVDLRAQYLTQQGFAVLKLDNRGSSRRGLAFEAAILGDLGNLEVRDQVAGVLHVTADGRIDASRVGIYGWSYGGYMALMCLLRAPSVFRAAVAGAPVTDWGGYDTHYTERYMRRPQENPGGYRSSSTLEHAGKLEGALLIVHGMIDENVHFRHSARLVNALIQHGKAFDLLPFPNERHMPRSEADRLYMERRLVELFRRALQDADTQSTPLSASGRGARPSAN